VLALNRLVDVEFNNLDHIDQFVKLLGHLLEGKLIDVNHNGDARESLDFGVAHGKGFDVEAAARKKTGNARQQTRLVLYEKAQNV
jgi:hypothetical protein